jgi:GTP-binding protein
MTTTPNDAGDEKRFTAAELAAGDLLFRKPWSFLKSAPALEFLPPADRPEIAFAGRSNVGKSSLINALVAVRGLARTSNTPGRTQELNYYVPAATDMYFVDMPGYGFADAPKAKVDDWNNLIRNYLRGRPTLKRVFLLIDSRHGIKGVDREIMDLLNTSAVSFEIVLTKIDKLNKFQIEKIEATTQLAVSKEPAAFPRILATSSDKWLGIDQLRAEIALAAGFR